MNRTIRTKLLRPYIYNELPRWGWMYKSFIGDHARDADWTGMPPQVIRGKLHDYLMELNLGSWSERRTFFLGRFYDLATQLLLMETLRPGDRFVDVGANIGMLTLLASRLVGPEGRVDSVEPNPACVERIRGSVKRNTISNILLHNCAAGDGTGTATLSIPSWNSGEATLTKLETDGAGVRMVDVDVRRADDIVSTSAQAPVMIKIDVEGFELSVLRGLAETVRRHQPLMVLEVVSQHLARAGSSVADMFELMNSYGYVGLGLSTRRVGRRHRMSLTPCDARTAPNNVVWHIPGSPASQRLAAHVGHGLQVQPGRLSDGSARTQRSS